MDPIAEYEFAEQDPNRRLRLASRRLLNARVAMATGRHDPADEARAWDRFAMALDAAEDAAILTQTKDN